MKKVIQWLAVILLGVGIGGHAVQAASLSYTEFVQRYQAAQPYASSFHLNGLVELNLNGKQSQTPLDLTAKATLDTAVDVDHLNSLGDLVTEYNVVVPGAEMGDRYGMSWIIKGNKLFYRLPMEGWQVTNVELYRSIVQLQLAQMQLQSTTATEGKPQSLTTFNERQMNEVFDDLFEVVETDQQYSLSLKTDVDGEALYHQHETVLEAYKQAVIQEMQALAASDPETYNPETIDFFRRGFSAYSVGQFFASKPKFTMIFDKTTFYPTTLNTELNLDLAQFISADELKTQAFTTVKLVVNVTLDEYNQNIELIEPEVSQISDASSGVEESLSNSSAE